MSVKDGKKITWADSDGHHVAIWRGISASVHHYHDGDNEYWICKVWVGTDTGVALLLDTGVVGIVVHDACKGRALCEWVMRSYEFDPLTHSSYAVGEVD